MSTEATSTETTTTSPVPTGTGQQPRAPDTRGHSPALDRREQAAAGDAERRITIGGIERSEREVLDIMADHSQRQIAKAGLPQSPDKYEIKLPDGFKPPEGMQFEFRTDDPALAQARALAHAKGWSQQDFSEALGIFATTKLAEVQTINQARDREMGKLGAAGQQRIDAIETWLKAKVGDKAGIMVATLKNFPVAANVEALEGIIRAFSSQGGSTFTQSHRENEQPAGKIPGYENMGFVERRIAQMQSASRRGDR